MTDSAKKLLDLSAADIMSHSVVMIPREMSLQGAARMLARAGVTGAPVVDDNGRCIGVVSATDFMHLAETEHKPARRTMASECLCKPWQIPEHGTLPSCCVADFMTTDPVLVTPGAGIGELARLMMDAHIHRLIVVDPGTQRAIGIVSSMDILAAVARTDQAASEAEKDTIHDDRALVGAMY